MITAARISIALIWLYQGLWCKILRRAASHQHIVSAVPFVGAPHSRTAVTAIGTVECVIAVWVLSGQSLHSAAVVQTALLGVMNAGALLWTPALVADRTGMLLYNFVLVMLAWVVAQYAS
jgi:hypothetical protein